MLVTPDSPSDADPRQPRRVVDWNSLEVGHVLGTHRDPRTHHVDSLLVQLSPAARARLRDGPSRVLVPMRRVFGMRRDEITLDCSLEEMRSRLGQP